MKKENSNKKKKSDKAKKGKEIVNLEETKKIFLEKVIDLTKEPPKPYSIKDKLIAAKKNTNYLGFIFLFSFCFVLIVSSFLIVEYFRNTQERINLKIEEFSDINIKEILEQAASFKNQLVEKRSELESLKNQREARLDEINLIYNSRVNALFNQNISSEVRRSRQDIFLENKRRQEKEVNDQLTNRINELEIEVAGLSEKVTELDQEAISQAVKVDDFVNYQKQLYDARIESIQQENKQKFDSAVSSIVESYETKINELINNYNPTIIAANAEAILTEPRFEEGLENFSEINFSDNYLSAQEFGINSLNPYFISLTNFIENQQDGQVLLNQINSINFYNKTKEINEVIQLIFYQQFNDLKNLYKTILVQNQKQNLLIEMLNYYLQENSLMAIVIDKDENNKKLNIFIRDLYGEENYTKGLIFDFLTKKEVGEIIIEEKEGLFYQASTVADVEKIAKLSPIILIK